MAREPETFTIASLNLNGIRSAERHGFTKWLKKNRPDHLLLQEVRAYPDPKNAGRSISRISFYSRPEALETHREEVFSLMTDFAQIIRDEDYTVAARSQVGAESGLQESMLFGRNEPALHHYHNTYREALGMDPLPLIRD